MTPPGVRQDMSRQDHFGTCVKLDPQGSSQKADCKRKETVLKLITNTYLEKHEITDLACNTVHSRGTPPNAALGSKAGPASKIMGRGSHTEIIMLGLVVVV